MKSVISRLLAALGLSLWLLPASAFAAIELPWSTTFNCPESNQTQWFSSPPLDCDGLSRYGAWTTKSGSVEQITTEANYPGGAGGRGQRHWIGPGVNSNSGGLVVAFSTPQTEFWTRWMMRHESGMPGHGLYPKWLFINPLDINVYLGFWGDDDTYFHPQGYPGNIYGFGKGFRTVVGNGTMISDGGWDCYEVHLKQGTGNNGAVEMWINGILTISNNAVPMKQTSQGWRTINFGSNQKDGFGRKRDYYNDFDDIAISNTGRIGCLANTPSDTPPAVPQN